MDYVNASASGYVISYDLINLEKRVKPLQPDIIIIYKGFNDMASYAKGIAARQNKRYYKEGRFEKYSLAYDLIKKNLTIMMNRKNARSGKDRLVFEPEEISRGFRKELTDLIIAAKKIAPVVAVATLSYKIRRGQPDEEKLRNANTALYYMPYMSTSGLLDAYEEYNRVIRDVAKETGAILIDNELVIPGDDEHFRDSIHLSDQGSRMMAQRVVDSLAASVEYNNFLNSRSQK
jgi:lysophospholipase L1-like esterase